MRDRSTALFVVVLTLAVGAGGVLALGIRGPNEEKQAAEFHRLVGGLGFGPALTAGPCEFGFDPRLCPACSFETGHVPGGLHFCPHHASALFDYPSLPRRAPEAAADEHLP